MRKNLKSILFFTFMGSLLVASCQTKSSKKQEVKSSSHTHGTSIKWSDAWARPGSKGGNSAVYLKIINTTNDADTLLSISSNVAVKAAVHESYQENGMSGMRHAGKKRIAAGATLKLQPGGYHIMLVNLNRQLSKGDTIRVTLHFSHNGSKKITAPVKLKQ